MRSEEKVFLPATVTGMICAVVLGGVLLFSTYTKAIDPLGFAEQIARDGFMTAALAHPAALAVIAIEGALGLSLLLLIRRFPVVAGSTVLMAGFLALSIWQWIFPPAEPSSCGCFGNAVQQTPAQHAFLNSVFFLLALGTWLGRRAGSGKGWAFVPVAGLIVALGFSLAAPALPIDGWYAATRLVEGAEAADLRIDEVIPEAQDGQQLILVLDLADEETRIDVQRVNELLALAGGPVGVFGIAEANEELESEFFWTAGPAFEVRGAPYGLVKPLYRALPRSLLVEDGVVAQVWNEIPDEATLTRLAEGGQP